MRKPILFLLLAIISVKAYTATISGTIKEKNGAILPFSSILIKGTTQGVSANSKGFYSISLEPGEYTLVCQYIGHKAEERKIKLTRADLTINFELEQQQYTLNEVVVKSGGEDPAYEIIRKTIEKRAEHLKEIKKFQCEVYIKGQLQLRNYPKSFLGQKVDFEDGDTSKRKMLFLSETIAKYSVEEPDNRKVEVISTKVSGRSDGFGFSNPQFISFYENTLSLGRGLNPRGFISPIANNALNYYRYKLEGTFFENDRQISRIKVIPKRTYEPLFSGYINIIEDEWRIQSVDLKLLREQQMQLLDTLVIQQLYVPAGNLWIIKNQVIYPSGKFFGFDFFGSFVQVYDKFDLEPGFQKKFFNNTVLKFLDSSNKKTAAYWDSIRPLPLLQEELRDYKKKDSLEQVRKDPHYLDSLDKIRNKLTVAGLVLKGQSFSRQKSKSNINFDPLIRNLNYNTVEGGVINFSPNYSRSFEGRQSLFLSPDFRYGFGNHHFNPNLSGNYNFGKKYLHSISFSGGKKVFQYNNAQPISERINSISTLLYEANYMKIYEASFFKLGYSTGIGGGLTISGNFQFQNRQALNNLPDPVYWRDVKDREFTRNYPDLHPGSSVYYFMSDNKASIATLAITWRPGGKYIEFPDRKMSIGSRYPTFNASITKGINGFLGSDVDYTKWQVNISDNLNLKLGGRFRYNISASGFFDAKKTYVPDYQHYLGNQTILAQQYLSGFQLAPYYLYSNTASLNISAHAEYHLNGLLTNKIPGFKKLNWFFVLGGNALHIDKGADYYEAFFGIENIFKVLRVDFIQGYEKAGGLPSGFRISLPFFISGRGGN
jgi:hypothetical protein